jgi:hypothetical protein
MPPPSADAGLRPTRHYPHTDALDRRGRARGQAAGGVPDPVRGLARRDRAPPGRRPARRRRIRTRRPSISTREVLPGVRPGGSRGVRDARCGRWDTLEPPAPPILTESSRRSYAFPSRSTAEDHRDKRTRLTSRIVAAVVFHRSTTRCRGSHLRRGLRGRRRALAPGRRQPLVVRDAGVGRARAAGPVQPQAPRR